MKIERTVLADSVRFANVDILSMTDNTMAVKILIKKNFLLVRNEIIANFH